MINIRGKSIVLRALEPSDIDAIYNWENNTDFWLISATSGPFSRHVLQQYIESSHLDIYNTRQLRLVISLADGSEDIGTIDLFDFDPFNLRVGVGILIAEEQNRGKGYASESMDLLIDYCFNHLGVNQLYCNVLSDNEKSISLFESKGFSFIGTKKKWIRSGKKWLDENMYQLVN